jgi:spore coat protein U-like protein
MGSVTRSQILSHTPPRKRARHRFVVTMAAVAMLVAVSEAPAAGCLSASVTATGPAFGTYNPLIGAPTNSNGSVSVTCTVLAALGQSTTATVSLSAGASAVFATRAMQSGGNQLNYNLYIDNGYAQVWGDGTGGSSTVTDTFVFPLLGSTSQTVTATIYGQIPTSQLNVVPGSYTDTITVTINY